MSQRHLAPAPVRIGSLRREETGEVVGAARVYERALRQDAGFREAAVNLAILQAKAGQFAEARRTLKAFRGPGPADVVVESLLRNLPEAPTP